MKLKETIKRDLNYYIAAHQHPCNQQLHYFAFLFALLGWIFLFINLWITLIFALLHYILAWVGHFYFEGNKPAAFKYPWVGFYAGFTWFFIRSCEIILSKPFLKAWLDEQQSEE